MFYSHYTSNINITKFFLIYILMENHNSENKNKQYSQDTTNNFLEELEIFLSSSNKISEILTEYDKNIEIKNFHLEIEFDMTKLNLKYLEKILGCFMGFKSNQCESHKFKLMKLYDFTLYEFKRLRNKYEEINEIYYSLDEEQKFMINIKSFLDCNSLVPTKIGYLYIKLLNHYFKKILKYLLHFNKINFKMSEQEKDKFIFSVYFFLIFIRIKK